MLAEEAVPVDQLDLSAARDLLTQSQSQLAAAGSDLAKAEAQIAVEVSEALVKACDRPRHLTTRHPNSNT